jgi:hypothetical protein
MYATMGANFTKVQSVLSSVLQIVPTDNIKGLKTQPTTKGWHQKEKECSDTIVCSLSSSPVEFQESP